MNARGVNALSGPVSLPSKETPCSEPECGPVTLAALMVRC